MNTKEYAKYVVDNMHRATLPNALNIAKKFDVDYNFEEFLTEMELYVQSLIQQNKFDIHKCYRMCIIIQNTLSKYKSEIKYNKTFIFNDFIIDLWKVFDGN